MYFSFRRHPNHHFRNFCDDNPSNKPIITRKTRDHYAHVKKNVTIYRHKTEIENPKKKSTGKNIFFTKVLRPKKRK